MNMKLARACDVNLAERHATSRTSQCGAREPPENGQVVGQSKAVGTSEEAEERQAVELSQGSSGESVGEASCDTRSWSPRPEGRHEAKHEVHLRTDESKCAAAGCGAQDASQNVHTQARWLHGAPDQKTSHTPASYRLQPPDQHYVYQSPLPPSAPVYPGQQAQFLPIAVHGQYQVATPNFTTYSLGPSQLFWNQPQVAYSAPLVPTAPPLNGAPLPVSHYQPFCQPQAPLIGAQQAYAAPLQFGAQPQLHQQQHPCPVEGASRPVAYYASSQATGEQQYQEQQTPRWSGRVVEGSARRQSASESARSGRVSEDEADRASMFEELSEANAEAKTNAADDNEIAPVAQHNAGDEAPGSVAADSETHCEQSQRRRHDEQQRRADARTDKISYRVRLARNDQLERPTDCHFVDKRPAQERQTPTQSGTLAPLSTATPLPEGAAAREAPTSTQEPAESKCSPRKPSSDDIVSCSSVSMVRSHERTSTRALNDNEQEADGKVDLGRGDTCERYRRSLREKEVFEGTNYENPMSLEKAKLVADGETHYEGVDIEKSSKLQRDDASHRAATATTQESCRPVQQSTGCQLNDDDRKQPGAAPNKHIHTQTSHVSINGTTFYNVPNGLLNRLGQHHLPPHTPQQPYNSHFLLPYPSYHGAYHYYHHVQPFAVAYPYCYNQQPTMTFGSHQQPSPLGHEMTPAFYQSAAPLYHAFFNQHAHPLAAHQSSPYIASQTSAGHVSSHHHCLEGGPINGLNLGFSQLKLGYNLIPLLPIDASPTRIRQAYGMDKVWQDEFEMLFSKFVSSVVWTLVEVETVPNVRNTSRILNYKGCFIVRVGSSSSSSRQSSEKSFIVAGSNDSPTPSVRTPSCSSESDENVPECGSANEPVNDQSIMSDDVNEDEQEAECASLDCADDKVMDSDQGQSDCDSGAIFNSSTSGSSESTNHECNESEAGGQKITPPASPALLQLEQQADKNVARPPPMSMAPAHGRKFPLRFKMFIDSAKVRFCCENCGHGWTSMKGRVVFWYELFELIDEADGISNLIGYCAYKLFGQQCDVCKIENRFERPMWYPEEVTKVLANLYNKIGQVYFGFKLPTIDKQRRAGKPKTSHNSLLCQACHDGVCTDRK